MIRLSNWEHRLNEYIASVRDKPFVWGEHDCCTNFFDAVEAMSGQDLWHDFRGKYSTKLGALRALKRYGAGDVESTIDARCEVLPVGLIRRGDGVWDGENLGVCMGSYALFLTETGMARVLRADWVKGWSTWAS